MKKKAFALRIHPVLLEKIEKWAADEFRSVNGQIEWILQQALKNTGRLKTPSSSLETSDNNDTDNTTHHE